MLLTLLTMWISFCVSMVLWSKWAGYFLTVECHFIRHLPIFCHDIKLFVNSLLKLQKYLVLVTCSASAVTI